MPSNRTHSAATSDDLVLALLLEGRSRAEIAVTLSLARATVDHVVRRLAFDAGHATAAELVAGIWAQRVAERDRTIAALTATLAILGRRSGDRPSI